MNCQYGEWTHTQPNPTQFQSQPDAMSCTRDHRFNRWMHKHEDLGSNYGGPHLLRSLHLSMGNPQLMEF